VLESFQGKYQEVIGREKQWGKTYDWAMIEFRSSITTPISNGNGARQVGRANAGSEALPCRNASECMLCLGMYGDARGLGRWRRGLGRWRRGLGDVEARRVK